MIRVAAGEARVIGLARAALGVEHGVGAALREAADVPSGLTTDGRGMLEDTLARGAVLRLARAGWRRRIWERRDPVPLPFTERSVRLLQWAAREELGRPGPTGIERLDALGDELLAHGLARLLARHGLRAALDREPFASSALVGVALGDVVPFLPRDPDWLDGGRALVLEALQDELAADAVRVEAALLADPTGELGSAREAMLTSLLDALDQGGRRDLAGFLPRAARFFADGPMPPDDDGTLARRQSAAIAAGAQLRAIERIGRWSDELAAIRHFDDGYGAARDTLREWRLDPHLRRMLADRERNRRSIRAPTTSAAR